MAKLKVSKRFGEVYGESSSPGSFTIFCPSCPQPGVNLPPDWKHLPSWVTRRTITVDGNFHADHIKMRRPDLDIKLTNGQGYMADEVRYQEYLSVVKEPCVVCRFLNLPSFFKIYETRGHHVRITKPSMQQTPTTDATWMLPESSPAVAQDMDVSSPLRSAICRRESGKRKFLDPLRTELNYVGH